MLPWLRFRRETVLFLNQFDRMMTDWAATEKRKDQRDWDKLDEDIGHFMGYLMLTPVSRGCFALASGTPPDNNSA